MKGEIYKQCYPHFTERKHITEKDIDYGFIKIKCQDCDGTGLFAMPEPDQYEDCVACKSTGWLWATL